MELERHSMSLHMNYNISDHEQEKLVVHYPHVILVDILNIDIANEFLKENKLVFNKDYLIILQKSTEVVYRRDLPSLYCFRDDHILPFFKLSMPAVPDNPEDTAATIIKRQIHKLFYNSEY